MIYLLSNWRLQPDNYSEWKLNMNHFIQATEYKMIMYAKIQYLILYRFL
jgi:hypothetical protein